MIMRLLRKYFSYWVFAILLVALTIGLVSGGFSSGTTSAVAVVNGQAIPYDQYAALEQNAENQQREKMGKDLSDAELAKLRQNLLDQMVDETLALQGLDKLHLTMSTEEIQQDLMGIFRDEKGNYSPERYQQYLQNQVNQGRTIQQTEDNISRSLALSKAQNFWRNQALVAPADIDHSLKLMQREAKAELLVWSFKKLQALQKPTDDDLRSYYSQNRQTWVKAEQVKARHILIKVDAISGTTEAKAKADALYKRIKAGEDFAKLAKQYSEDEGSAKKGGELGYFSKNDMVPEFANEAFSLKVGEVGAPVLSKFGWHIIQVEGKKPGFDPTYDNCKDKVSDGLTLELARKQADREASQAQQSLQSGEDLEAAAKGLHGVLLQSDWFKLDSKAIVPGLGDTTTLASDLLALSNGENLSQPVTLDQGIVLGGVRSDRPGTPIKDTAKLAKLHSQVIQNLEEEKATNLYDAWIKSMKATSKITERLDAFYGGATK